MTDNLPAEAITADPHPEGNPALAAAVEAIVRRRLASPCYAGLRAPANLDRARAAILLDALPDAAAALEAAAPAIRQQATTAERERLLGDLANVKIVMTYPGSDYPVDAIPWANVLSVFSRAGLPNRGEPVHAVGEEDDQPLCFTTDEHYTANGGARVTISHNPDRVTCTDCRQLLDPAEPIGADAEPGETGSVFTTDGDDHEETITP